MGEYEKGLADAYENAAVLATLFQGSAKDFARVLREHAEAIRRKAEQT